MPAILRRSLVKAPDGVACMLRSLCHHEILPHHLWCFARAVQILRHLFPGPHVTKRPRFRLAAPLRFRDQRRPNHREFLAVEFYASCGTAELSRPALVFQEGLGGWL